MAKTYSQLLQNIEVLKRQAEERRKTEIAGVVGRIREAIKFYGLTATDLGLGGGHSGGVAAKAGRQAAKPVVVRYADAAGNAWSGRGPRPRWLREALANGQTLESLRRESSAAKRAVAPGRGGKKKVRKAARKVKFRDVSGNTWGGMGKRPQWLRDALASGKRLEDFLVTGGNGAGAESA
jgi:DNA-binding protein H-NS